jgi:hypothetical protein
VDFIRSAERISFIPLGDYVRKTFPFFSLTPLAQRKEPKETPRIFRACGRDSGLCPKSPVAF